MSELQTPAEGEFEAPAEEIKLLPCPEPGLYPNAPEDKYRRWDAANASSLKIIGAKSPMHCDYQRRHPKAPTPALIMGTAIHLLALEGEEKYAATYKIIGGCFATKKSGQPCTNAAKVVRSGQPFCGVHDPVKGEPFDDLVWSKGQDDIVRAVVASLRRSDIGRNLLDSDPDGLNEVAMVWDDEKTGQRCKAKIDALRPQWQRICDIKSCLDASRQEFERTVADREYDIQAVFYLEGSLRCYQQCGDKRLADMQGFTFLCTEKSPPYPSAFYDWMPGDQEMTPISAEIQRCLRIWKHCRETGRWYGYADELRQIRISQYRLRKLIDRGV